MEMKYPASTYAAPNRQQKPLDPPTMTPGNKTRTYKQNPPPLYGQLQRAMQSITAQREQSSELTTETPSENLSAIERFLNVVCTSALQYDKNKLCFAGDTQALCEVSQQLNGYFKEFTASSAYSCHRHLCRELSVALKALSGDHGDFTAEQAVLDILAAMLVRVFQQPGSHNS